MTIAYDIDPEHVKTCDKPVASCKQCSEAFGLKEGQR